MKNLLCLVIPLCVLIGTNTRAQAYKEFYEDFSDNKNSWRILNDQENFSNIQSGQFVMARKVKSGAGYWIEQLINPKKDFTIETQMTQISGVENNGYGILFGKYDNWRDYYAFVISSDGHAKVYGNVDGGTDLIKSWTPFKKINPMGRANVLKIEKIGEKIKFWINDKLFFTTEAISIIGRLHGFKIDSQMKIKVDYLRIKYWDEPINLVKNPNNGYEKENLGDKINSAYEEKSPFISADGSTLYYSRDNHPENNKEGKSDIWFSEKDNKGEWQESVHMPAPLNNNGHNYIISVTPDENTALVGNVYAADGSLVGGGVSISQKTNGKWQLPIKQEIMNFRNLDRYASYFLTADRTKLLASIDNGTGEGDKDIFVCFLTENNTWSVPKNLGPNVNSFASDFAPFLSVDGRTLFFASYGHPGYGSADVFVTKRLDDTWTNWSKPQNLGPEINTSAWEGYYTLSAQGDYAYMVSTQNSLGRGDLFKIQIGESYQPDPTLIVKGRVFNAKTKKAINAEIEYENLGTGKREGLAQSEVTSGYKIVLPSGENYGFRAKAEGFIPISQNLDLENLEAFSEKEIDLYLVPIEKGQVIRLNNIFFDFGKAMLTEASFLELNRLVSILNNNPNLRIELSGHTDDKGEYQFNLKLSEDRAKAVVEYLVQKGIDPKRLESKGYGESRPVDTNETDEGRQLNRRVEFVILES